MGWDGEELRGFVSDSLRWVVVVGSGGSGQRDEGGGGLECCWWQKPGHMVTACCELPVAVLKMGDAGGVGSVG